MKISASYEKSLLSLVDFLQCSNFYWMVKKFFFEAYIVIVGISRFSHVILATSRWCFHALKEGTFKGSNIIW